VWAVHYTDWWVAEEIDSEVVVVVVEAKEDDD